MNHARKYLKTYRDSIIAAIHIDDPHASKSHMQLRLTDLEKMASVGGDSHETSLNIAEESMVLKPGSSSNCIDVIGLATGTWPSSSGGVSNCIRDLVDNLKSIRWNILCENAHDLGKFIFFHILACM